MTRPGDRVRALTARWYTETTMARVIDPGVADLQREYHEAITCGRAWKGRWVRLAGYVALMKVIAFCTWEQTMQTLHGWTLDDRRVLFRTIARSVLAVAFVTCGLMIRPPIFVAGRVSKNGSPRQPETL